MPERQKKATKGKVMVKKKSLKERFLKNLNMGDKETLTDYIIDELIFPTIFSGINRIITGTSNHIFGGNGIFNNPGSFKQVGNAPHIDYKSISNGPKPAYTQSRYNIKRFLFKDRTDADTVKDQLIALIESQYQAASVGDLYDLVGEETQSTDWNYGWKSTKGISVKYTNDGYILDMPNPIPIR